MASIFKTSKGLWAYRIHKIINGKEVSKYKTGFKSKNEAKNSAVMMENSILKGAQVNNNVSFADYYYRWFCDTKKGQYTVKSENAYLNVYHRIINYFGSKPLNKITHREYQAFVNEYSKDHAKETVRKLNSFCHAMVMEAINEKIIYTDFVYGTKNNGNDGKRDNLKYLNEQDFINLKQAALKQASFKHISDYMILVACYTGLRYEEICGLTWQAIDFKNKILSVERAYDYAISKQFTKLKTASSNRKIAIPDELITILKKLRREQSEYYLQHNYRDDMNLLFRSIYNQLAVPTNAAANKELRKLQNEIHIPKDNQITFHGLRHTHASYLISHNIPISYVSKRLGHKDISITLKVYTHLLNEVEQRNAQQAMLLLNEL